MAWDHQRAMGRRRARPKRSEEYARYPIPLAEQHNQAQPRAARRTAFLPQASKARQIGNMSYFINRNGHSRRIIAERRFMMLLAGRVGGGGDKGIKKR